MYCNYLPLLYSVYLALLLIALIGGPKYKVSNFIACKLLSSVSTPGMKKYL